MSRDRFSIGRNVRFAIAEFLINIGLVFATYRLIVLQGGLEAVGLWSSLFAWTSLIRIGDVGMANATLRFVAVSTDDRPSIRRYVETGILANAALFALLAPAGYVALLPFVGQLAGAAHAPMALAVLPVMFLGFFLFNLAGVVLGALQGLHLGYRRSQISVLGATVQLLAVVALVPSLHLLGLAWAQVAQHGVTIVLAWLLVRRAAGIPTWLPLHFDRRAFVEMLRYSLVSQLANLGNGLFEPVSKLVVGFFIGLPGLGLYELAYKTVSLSRNVVAAAITAALPAMSSLLAARSAAARPLYDRMVRLSTLAMLALAAALVPLAPVVSLLWLGSVDLTYWIFVLIIAAGFTVNTISAPAYNLGAASGNQRGNLAASWLSLLALLLLGPIGGLLSPQYGVVVATAIAMALGALLVRHLNEPLLNP